MGNSAHDDIRLTIDSQQIALYQQRLNNCAVGQHGDAGRLLKLIARIGDAAGHEDPRFQVITLRLKHFSNPVSVEFEVQTVELEGWLEHLPHEAAHCLELGEYQALLRALKESDFELDFRLPEPEHLSFGQLIDNLDQFRIGRPSTLGQTLEDMETGRMLVIDGDEVRLTATAYKVLHDMQQRYPAMANKNFSARLALLQQKLERDELSAASALAELLPDLLPHFDSTSLTEDIWDDIESFYEPLDEAPQAPLQGLIRQRAGDES
ncbi:hypothetical protein ALQ04_02216 [Pseudomonas cichorii]|uniref:Topo IA-type catalytic domain-containing protein n=1 Tax=Pseudomonas cichorii TaxID=36746 RepID=A0A3M4LS67_PSECI|nr:hypothetical protein [Pseudomonas cichorii]RMQ44326.1 hypothetical protein ALQ04_02216 [Pseudomonas cichorii]